MSQATEQVKKVKGEGFKWGQELLKAKAIIKEQQEKIEELTDRANWTNEECIRHLQEKGYWVETKETHDAHGANWTTEECIRHLESEGYYVETKEAYEEEIESWRRSDLEAELEDVREELENLKTDRVAAFELLDKDPNYFVCTTEERDKLWTEEDLKLEGYVLTKGKLTQIISQEDEKEDSLYWGATDGYLTIWRVPENVVVPDDYFSHSECLGVEWGGLSAAHFRTITQKMIDTNDFDEYVDDSDSEKTCCKCKEKFEDSLNSPMCDDCYEKLGDDKESRLRKYSQEVHGMEGAVYDAFRAVVFK